MQEVLGHWEVAGPFLGKSAAGNCLHNLGFWIVANAGDTKHIDCVLPFLLIIMEVENDPILKGNKPRGNLFPTCMIMGGKVIGKNGIPFHTHTQKGETNSSKFSKHVFCWGNMSPGFIVT